MQRVAAKFQKLLSHLKPVLQIQRTPSSSPNLSISSVMRTMPWYPCGQRGGHFAQGSLHLGSGYCYSYFNHSYYTTSATTPTLAVPAPPGWQPQTGPGERQSPCHSACPSDWGGCLFDVIHWVFSFMWSMKTTPVAGGRDASVVTYVTSWNNISRPETNKQTNKPPTYIGANSTISTASLILSQISQ